MITTMSLVNICHHTKLKHFFSCDENFLRFILNNFQICNTILLTIVTMLYITSPQLIYLITGSLYLLTPFTHFTYPQTPSPLATTHLFSVSTSVVLFCFEKQERIFLVDVMRMLEGPALINKVCSHLPYYSITQKVETLSLDTL